MKEVNRIKIPGPPGTGKTHRLIHHYLNKEINEYKTPQFKILYVGFSNAAVDEAKERINKLYPGNEIQISTLHALGRQTLNLDTKLLLKGKRWGEFKTVKGHGDIDFGGHESSESSHYEYDSDILKLIQYTKNKLKGRDDIGHMAFEMGLQDDVNIDAAKQLYQDIEDYKRDSKMYEFSDMIKKFIDNDCRLSLDAVFLDEAQDLNPLQWEMFYQIESTCDRSYIAGDDDQTIFSFTAASPTEFINLEGELDAQIQSNRVPINIHKEAMNVLSNITERLEKEWLPRGGDPGEVIDNLDLGDIDFEKENWMILTRINKQQDNIIEHLESQEQYFFCPRAELVTEKMIKAWRVWDRLNQGASVSGEEAALLYNQFIRWDKGNGNVSRGHADEKKLEKLYTVSLEELKENHGLLIEGDWKQLKMSPDQINYIQGLLDKGEDLYQDPRITVSTIHKAKGKECDNVILFTDISYKPFIQAIKSQRFKDTEHRVWFVGVTRAKKKLFYINNNTKYQYTTGEDIQ